VPIIHEVSIIPYPEDGQTIEIGAVGSEGTVSSD
jgi:hypothetical protein